MEGLEDWRDGDAFLCGHECFHFHFAYVFFLFFFNDPATTEIYTLSLHDALPIPLEPVSPHPPDPCSGEPDVHRSDLDRKSTRLNSSHMSISYAVFCLKKKKKKSCLYTALKRRNESNHT